VSAKDGNRLDFVTAFRSNKLLQTLFDSFKLLLSSSELTAVPTANDFVTLPPTCLTLRMLVERCWKSGYLATLVFSAETMLPLFFDSLADQLLDAGENTCREEICRPKPDMRGGVLSLELETDEDAASFFDSSIIFLNDRRKTVVPSVDATFNGGQTLDAVSSGS